MKALTFSRFGGPEVLEYTDVPQPRIEAGEVLVALRAVGLNYADIYRRRGDYHLAGDPPWIAGYEGSGVVLDTLAPGVEIGDRVAFADVPYANAQYAKVPAEHVIPVPEGMDLRTPAAVLLQGLTAQYLMEDSYPVRAGDVVLIHAAAGGVGRILTQLCKAAGAEVIGLSRSADKLAVVRECGADHAVRLDANWLETVSDLTEGRGVDVAYDSVGATLADSFTAVRDRGTVVFYGMSGGDPDPVDPRLLMDTSKTLVGGDLWSYLTSGDERRARAARLFGRIADGTVRLTDPVEFALSDGAAAHAYLEEGRSAGKVLLLPDAGD